MVSSLDLDLGLYPKKRYAVPVQQDLVVLLRSRRLMSVTAIGFEVVIDGLSACHALTVSYRLITARRTYRLRPCKQWCLLHPPRLD